uniref:Putative carboxypeptidase G2 chain A n=1 Tax=uncultured Acidobacteriota bacterium TaxID=171953 RepID=Q7X340_9BACT|nr:putative carboxypeptidase G2 chain A [uncultured Acidobacteriota bacterium]
MRILLAAGVAASLFVAHAAAVQQSLSAVEQRLVAQADASRAEAEQLLERAVNINSGTMNLAGVKRVGDLFDAEFKALGFKTSWRDGAAFKRAGHLIAERPGKGLRILLIGHLDTVFEADSPFQKYERINADTARGPGVIDMKGGNVVIVHALKALAVANVLDGMAITVVMTGDEEDPGEPLALARQALYEAGKAADIAIGFENGNNNPANANISRRGFTGWTLRVQGTPAHSSQVFTDAVGAGAIYELSRVLNGFYTRLSTEALLSLNPGLVLGGTTVDFDAGQSRGTAFGKTNVVAEHAVVTGDLRGISAQQVESTKTAMQQVVAAHLPKTAAELVFDDSYPPMAPTDGNRGLLARLSAASRDLGLGEITAVDPRAAGAADISFVANDVDMAIDALGLKGKADHTVDETADLRLLPVQIKRAAVLLFRLTH